MAGKKLAAQRAKAAAASVEPSMAKPHKEPRPRPRKQQLPAPETDEIASEEEDRDVIESEESSVCSLKSVDAMNAHVSSLVSQHVALAPFLLLFFLLII